MVSTAGTPGQFMSFTHHGAQSLAYPLVLLWKNVGDAMLEVAKPPFDGDIHSSDDLRHRPGVQSSGLLADGLSELVQTLLAWPAIAPLEVVAQKVEPASLTGVHDARFDGMQR